MANYRLTKQALKQLKKLVKSDIKIARRIKKALLLIDAEENLVESLQGHSECFKVRIGKYRLIHTKINNVIIIALIPKSRYRKYDASTSP
ncbi:hypothetical protein MNBD_GAMMA01-1715 [hydrothermal vent metagenome]|uniref:RelE/StbE replicon stabilization toxin n=1 Tax=hydrothermal vent metagenome TaxID=652676 RepID=A0A3B0WA72_9ZZZZ